MSQECSRLVREMTVGALTNRRTAAVVILTLVSVLVVGVIPTYGSAFPGVNGKIAFTRGAGANRHIYSVNPDGSGAVDLTPTGAEVYNDQSAISADGTRIVFVSNRDYAPCCVGQDLYVMNSDSSGLSRLTMTPDTRFPQRPTWSTDGNKIAYVSGGQIWTMNPDGTAQTARTGDATDHDTPSWSPDGRRIAFTRRFQPGDTGARIYVMNADGTGAFPVSSNSGVDGGPISWSPDGTLVAYTSSRDGGGEIWLGASDGSGEHSDAFVKCCRGPGIEAPGGGSPAWSPDGLHLAFESNGLTSDPAYPMHSIFRVDSGGGGLTRLTHFDGDSSPTWGASRLVDRTPPTTSASLSGTVGTNTWYTSAVLVTLSATDEAGSGVAATFYAIDDPTCTPAALSTCGKYSGPFSVAADGTHAVTFFSRDNAANVEALASVSLKIDTMAPTISAAAAPPPNSNGWNDATLTLTFSCSDAISGIASCPMPQTVTTEGAAQKVTGMAIDQAGNTTSGSASVSIDLTAPTITATATTADGNSYAPGSWTNQTVTVTFQCADALSGVATCSSASTVATEGAAQTTSGSATDKADNTATTSFSGINIDKTPPITLATLKGTSGLRGWYTSPVTVTISAADGLSGVATTTYTLDGSLPQVYADPFAIGTDGRHMLVVASVDVAGNMEIPRGQQINIDRTPPSSTGTLVGGALGLNGWYFISPTISLSSNDTASALAAIYYQFVPHGALAPTQSLPGSWIAYVTPFTAPFADSDLYAFGVDIAGNMEAPISLGELKVDGVHPTTTALLSGTPGNMGWYRSTVTVTLTATDDLSGVASTRYGLDSPQMQTYSRPFTIATDGVHYLTFNSADLAGNTESGAVAQVKVDQLAPVTTITASRGALAPGVDALSVTGTATVKSTTGGVLGSFSVQCWNTPSAVIAFSATDGSSGSGMASITYGASGAQTIRPTTVLGASAMTLVNTAGQTTVTVAATDVAGNMEATHSESVIVQMGTAGTGFACAGPTPTSFAMPAHGTLVVTGTTVINGSSGPFTRTINF